MIKKIIRFLAAPVFLLMFVVGFGIIWFFEYIFDDMEDPRMSDELLEMAQEIIPWLIFRD